MVAYMRPCPESVKRAGLYTSDIRGGNIVDLALEVHGMLPVYLATHTRGFIWDTGTSLRLTPFRCDFIDYVKCEILVKDIMYNVKFQ